MENSFQILEKAMAFLEDVVFHHLPRLIVALIVLWVGLKLIKVLCKYLDKSMTKKKVDVSLKAFLISVIDIALKALVIVTVLSMVGIKMTSFIAMLGAAGLAVGMALQGTLQNFAGGVIVLLLRPYRVGDFIEQGGISGTVKSIQIFNTVLNTPDNKVIIVPNTELATKTLINYSKSETRRVDINVGIAYGESIDKARDAMLKIADGYADVLKDPAAAVVVTSLAESSVNLSLRVWVKNDNYWSSMNDLTKAVYDKFNEMNITIPFNQLDVHVINEK